MSPNKATAKDEEKADPPQRISKEISILLRWRKLVDDCKSTAGSANKPERTTLLPQLDERMNEINDKLDGQEDKIGAIIEYPLGGDKEADRIKLFFCAQCILSTEIRENWRIIWAIDYLNWLAGQDVTDNDLLSYEEGFREDERWPICYLIKETEKTATRCKKEDKILDFERWLHQQSIFCGHIAFKLESLYGYLVKTHWRAETDEEKEGLIAKFGQVGGLLFDEAARANRGELSNIALRSRERSDGKIAATSSEIIFEISKRIEPSGVLSWKLCLPPGFLECCSPSLGL
ncbi:uncharacterized protein TRUGW13939_04686 [Talaromyces rugulosus]|uniref:Uncharacterized protein n=1 Tax=Talaromyces rugulosus TaxID=121627 RepID=A0A7H8QV12_TALRU|nr:uncharacterized protein TRUGW13939_04686 [Talaromyces rugulosus]QKX57568.1 hypothetical protein TRUGW13939_04686 [Talaromyces rugulosus]